MYSKTTKPQPRQNPHFSLRQRTERLGRKPRPARVLRDYPATTPPKPNSRTDGKAGGLATIKPLPAYLKTYHATTLPKPALSPRQTKGNSWQHNTAPVFNTYQTHTIPPDRKEGGLAESQELLTYSTYTKPQPCQSPHTSRKKRREMFSKTPRTACVFKKYRAAARTSPTDFAQPVKVAAWQKARNCSCIHRLPSHTHAETQTFHTDRKAGGLGERQELLA